MNAAKFPEVPEHRGGSGLTPPARQMSAADEPLDGRAGDAGSNPAGASGRSAATLRDKVYPHSGTCAYCERERDDLFWHAHDRKFYCADIARCEARAHLKATGAYA